MPAMVPALCVSLTIARIGICYCSIIVLRSNNQTPGGYQMTENNGQDRAAPSTDNRTVAHDAGQSPAHR